MAAKKTKETATKKPAEGADKPAGGKSKWLLLIGLLLVVGVGAGGAAYYFLIMNPAAEAETALAEDEPHAPPPLQYFPLDPLTANLPPDGPARFLRVSLTLATREDSVMAALSQHLPMIRNDLLAHLAKQQFAALNTPEGKDQLRAEAQELVTGVLVRTGQPAGIETVLLTDLVMQ